MRVEFRAEFADLRAEVQGARSDLLAFHRQVMVILAGFVVALIGLLGVSLA